VFGSITTGAADDLKRVGEMAQAMVHDYGMGSSLSSRKIGVEGDQLSDMTRRIRDHEENELADEGHRRARQLIVCHREKLDALAESLLANEVLERPEIDRVMGDDAVTERGPLPGLRVAAATEHQEPGDKSK
jgi:ATP-dependent Zn protease